MTDAAICAAWDACRRARSRDPMRVAQEMDVTVLTRSDFVAQKGAFSMVLGYPFIFLSDRLSEGEKKTVLAHELGHAALHRELAQREVLCEFDLFNMATGVEYEANVFAAELLIDPQEMDECLSGGMDIYSAAGALGVNVNLLIIKLAELNRRGGHYRLPYLPDRDFLGGKL